MILRTNSNLSILWENGEIEVVVVVRDGHLTGGIDADSDWVVGDPWNKNQIVKNDLNL